MAYADRNIQLNFTAFADGGNGRCYASSNSLNGLFEVDMDSRKCKYLGRFPKELPLRRFLYTFALRYENRIVFVPNSADNIAVYDIESEEFLSLPIKIKTVSEKLIWHKFACAVTYENFVYIVGNAYPYVLCLNMDTYEMKEIELDDQDVSFSRKGMVERGGSFLVPAYNVGKVLEFDMRKNQYKIHKLSKDFRGAVAMCADESGTLWIAPYFTDDPILKWTPKQGVLKKIDSFPTEFSTENHGLFSKAIYRDGEIWFIPEKANMSLRIDVLDGTVAENKFFPRLEKEKRIYCFEYKEKYYFEKRLLTQKPAWARINPYVELDGNTWKQQEIFFSFSEGMERYLDDLSEYYEKTQNNVSFETVAGIRLADYLEYHAEKWQ